MTVSSNKKMIPVVAALIGLALFSWLAVTLKKNELPNSEQTHAEESEQMRGMSKSAGY